MSSVSSVTPSAPGASGPVMVIAKMLRANLQTYALIFATVIIWIYFSYLTEGSFLSPQNFSNLFRQMVITGFLSVGMVLVIVTGNIEMLSGRPPQNLEAVLSAALPGRGGKA